MARSRSTSTLKTMRAISAVLVLSSWRFGSYRGKPDEALGHIDRMEANSVGVCSASPTSRFYSSRNVQGQEN